jgi:PAS domain S-box-containing protein
MDARLESIHTRLAGALPLPTAGAPSAAPAPASGPSDRQFTIAEKVFAGGFIAAMIVLPLIVLLTLQEANGNQMRRHTQEISGAIDNLRRYYATNVIQRLQQSGGRAVFTEKYKEVAGGIPIPATFSIEIGELFGEFHQDAASVKFGFVSDHPYASRTRPPLDAFQARALAAFRADPSLRSFSSPSPSLFGGGQFRYATPVIMGAACVACHNTHPDSPKRDWQIGDIRGIQDVGVGSIDSNLGDYRYLFYFFGLLVVLGVGAVSVFRRTALRLRASNLELQDARRSQAEFAARLEEKVSELSLLAAVADNSAFGITIVDARAPGLPIVYANQAFCRLSGYPREEVVGRNCRFLRGEGTSEEATSGLRSAIASGQTHTVELLNYRKNGSPFWNRLTIFPVGGTSGRPDFYVGYQIDVTASREAEVERAAMLTEIQEGQKLESLGILVAGVAHEINNPLGIALTATSHIAQSAEDARRALEAKGQLAPEFSEFLADEREAFELVAANLKRAATLVKGFREIAADRSQHSRRVVDVAQYLETLAGTFVPLMRRARCELVVDAPAGIRASIDTGAFGQLITNLVVNATVHAFAGIASPRIRITAALVGTSIRVTVEDNGVGIAPTALPQLFTPFFTTRRADGGTGLGLFISRRIANESLHGELVAESGASAGTRMVLTFPA